MDNRDLLLSIDNGTQSLKALIFDLQGNLLAKEQVVFTPYYSENPGWAEQDPEVFWKALCRACKGIFDKSGISKERIAGVSLTTQRGTVINVGREGKPLRPAMLWLDQRKSYGLKPVGGPWGIIFKVSGLRGTVAYLQAEAEANWIKSQQPEIWEKTYKYLLLSGYLTHKMVGEFVDSVGCQVGYIPFEYKKLRWASSWSWKWKVLPVEKEMLPKLVPPGEILGKITQKASVETGIPAGLPLIAAAADKACEVIGSGSLDPSIGCLSYGTTATINSTHNKYIEPIPLLPAYPSAVKDYYSLEVQVFRGYWMVNWFKEEFGHKEKTEAEKIGSTAEEILEKLLEEIPPCSMGLMLQPFWTPGLKSPGPEAKGAIIGFGDVHTRGHLYRSMLEGLAYALREGRERIEKKSHIPITSLRVSGGGSQSNQALQLTADVFGIPATRPHLYETSGLGAAIDASVGLGLHRDFQSAVKEMTRVGEVFEPNPSSHEMYDALYREVYLKMYKRLKPLYEKIREITGYPESGRSSKL
jgi:sugar (pentulose or hexulose) kinase